MFVISVDSSGKILNTQAADSELYSAECVVKDNLYYIRCADQNIVVCTVQQTEFTAPCTTQVRHVEGAIIVRFINQYGSPKLSSFTATIFVDNSFDPVEVVLPSQVFDGLRV